MYFSDISTACEDYIEVEDTLPEFDFSLTDLDEASCTVTDYAIARLSAIAKNYPAPIALMVSGGVDSLHMLACAVKAGIEVVAYTFSWTGFTQAEQEVAVAKEVCESLGVFHVAIRPADSAMANLLSEITARLQTSEPWEILSGSVLYSVAEKVPEDTAIISAAGADTLMLGGQDFAPSSSDSDTLGRWETQVKSDIRRGFTHHRFIPDFHQRILGSRAGRYFKLWQTYQAVDLISQLHPQVIRGSNWRDDKLVIRNAASQLGIDSAYLDANKSPMQVSSGGFAAIEQLARRELAHQFRGRTYSNPETEDVQLVLARLYLDRLCAMGGTPHAY